jgi:hypothetical protein
MEISEHEQTREQTKDFTVPTFSIKCTAMRYLEITSFPLPSTSF